MIKKFRIKWEDPETMEIKQVIEEFEGDDETAPEEWAEDYAYMLADKGWHEVVEVK